MKDPKAEKYFDVENDAVELIKTKFALIGDLSPLESKSPHVKMQVGYVEGDPVIVGTAEVLLDCTIEECAANEYMSYSRGALNAFYGREGGMSREFLHFNSHCFRNRSVYHGIAAFSPREFLWRVVWKKTDPDTIVLAYVPLVDSDVPCAKENVRAEAWTLVECKRVRNANGLEGTEMIYKTQLNLKGNFPQQIVDSQFAKRFLHLENVRVKFDMSLRIDTRNRAAIVGRMGVSHGYSVDES